MKEEAKQLIKHKVRLSTVDFFTSHSTNQKHKKEKKKEYNE